MLKISEKMQGKMTDFHTLNVSPLDIMFCEGMSRNPASVCHHCYSRKTLRTYAQQARKPWKENGRILSSRILTKDELPTTKKKYFRIHSHGELINDKHYFNLLEFIRNNPWCTFLLPTKRIDIIRKYGKMGVKNLVLSYSEPLLNHPVKKLPKYFDRRFSVFTKEYAEENNIDINCHGKRCIDCLQCYKGNLKFVNELLK